MRECLLIRAVMYKDRPIAGLRSKWGLLRLKSIHAKGSKVNSRESVLIKKDGEGLSSLINFFKAKLTSRISHLLFLMGLILFVTVDIIINFLLGQKSL